MAVVSLIFWTQVRDRPEERGLPAFNDEVELEKQIEGDARSGLMVVLTNRILWTVALVYFCFCYVQFGCLVWIPSFLKEGYAMSVERASTISAIILLPGTLASPIAGFLSDHYFNGRRKPLILLGMIVLSASNLVLFLGVNLILASCVLCVVGLMIIMPDILLAAYPSDILSRKLSATAMGFLTTFTSIAGIVTTPLSGKIVDLYDSYYAVFFSFAAVAFAGGLLTLCIREKNIFSGRENS
jgi:OPA family glycerol-3-phosphate transporter-like MFS transporter